MVFLFLAIVAVALIVLAVRKLAGAGSPSRYDPTSGTDSFNTISSSSGVDSLGYYAAHQAAHSASAHDFSSSASNTPVESDSGSGDSVDSGGSSFDGGAGDCGGGSSGDCGGGGGDSGG